MIGLKPNELLAHFAKEGAKLGDCGRMCNECAFKLNSAANLESHNVELGFLALLTGRGFNCHPQGGYGNAEKSCIGYKYADQHYKNQNQ